MPLPRCKYPPAEPGALGLEPPKAAFMGSLTQPHSRRLKAALSPEFELIQPLILLLLVAYVDADGLLVSAHSVYEVPARPEVLTHEVALSLPVKPGPNGSRFCP